MQALLLLSFLLTFPWALARAQTSLSPNVAPGHFLYDLLDSLDAHRCLRSTYRLIKPQAYLDLRRAIFVPEGTPCSAPEWLLLRTKAFESPQYANRARAQTLVFRDDVVPLAGVDAAVLPAFPFQAGRPLVNGGNFYAELDLGIGAGRDWGLAAGIIPGWGGGWDWGSSLRGQFYLYEGYLKAGYRRAEITWGRTQLELGDARHGTLLLSRAAKPLDLVKLSVRPHVLGTPFGFLGSFTVESFLAWQGDRSGVPGAKLWGVALGIRPAPFFETGFLQLHQLGGTGAPSLDAGDALALFALGGDPQKTNRMLAWHVNAWLFRHALKLYWQVAFERLGRPADWLERDLSWLLGAFLGRLGEVTLRLEVARTAPRAYTDGFWTQGLVHDGTPLGHPLGPDGLGAYFDVGLPNAGGFDLELGLFLEERGRGLAGSLAREQRIGASFGLNRRWGRYQLAASAYYARANEHRFVPGARNDIGAVQATLHYLLF